jgi:intraflagellar transport protein 122
MSLGAFKLARQTYERLGTLQIPSRRLEEVEHDMLIVQAKPMNDNPEHLPVCYRCGATNPLLNPFTNKFKKGDNCTNCGHPFIRSFITFDILPLVEFIPDSKSISNEEAIELIRQSPNSNSHGSRGALANKKNKSGGWKEGKIGDSDMMTFDNPEEEDIEDEEKKGIERNKGIAGESDLFTRALNRTIDMQVYFFIIQYFI